MNITKRFIPIQASLERILDTTSPNKIEIQDGKVLYTIDGGFSFFDLSGIRYLKASVAAVESLETEENGQRTIKLSSFKGGLSVVKSDSGRYQIFYTDSSGQVNHVAGTSSTTGTGTVTWIDTDNGITGGPITTVGTIGLTGRALELHNLSATSGVIEASGETGLTTRAIDATSGGTSGSTKLITSGAVFSGLASKVGLTGDDNIAGVKNFIGTILYDGEEVATKQDLSTVFKYKGTKLTYTDLPSTGNEIGDVWNVEDTGNNYAWDGEEWDNLAGVVDLSDYYTKNQVDAGLSLKENASNKKTTLTNSAVDYPSTGAVKTYVDAGLLLKENVSNKKATITDSEDYYPSTGAVKTYVDTQITTINNSKVDNAPNDGKVYGQQYGDWTSLEDTAELRDALCFEGSWDPTSWTPRDVVDGGTI